MRTRGRPQGPHGLIRHRMELFLPSLLWVGLILGACSAAPEPIQTTGSYQRLPRDGTRLVVLANDRALADSVQQWLEDRNLEVVQAVTSACVSCDAQALRSDSVDIDEAVLVELSRSSQINRMSVTIRGVARNDAIDLWSGSAWNHMPADIVGEEAQRNAVILACHALSTIWRHRAGGIGLTRSTDFCHRPEAP